MVRYTKAYVVKYFKIVRYGVRGHYHAHYDSTPEDFGKDVVCCHQNHERHKECKLCR